MCLRAYTCVCGDSHSKGNQKVGRPTGEGGCKLSDNPGQTGEGGSENLDFGHTLECQINRGDVLLIFLEIS